ncbi:MAG TPA: roadblock/LC7 domain-containing protein [Pyrinomonadaceae bacterium]|jgi:predicted regulator of Ras-like GTPase activity (Roadblock/LC7/MglB family)
MFREVLHEAMSGTEGCLGVLIMGTDGIAVEKVWQDTQAEANLDIAIAEYTSLLSRAKRINGELNLGQLRELTVSSENRIFILHLVNADYFLAMILEAEGNFGRGRYELRRAELLLKNELAL